METKRILLTGVLALLAASAVSAGVAARSMSGGLLNTRIIGGSEVTDPTFVPYQVTIQNTFGEHVCGGSIVAPHWILTAAHCMEWPKQYLKVVTGTVNWTEPDAEYYIDNVRMHCGYNQPMYSNDIALLHLTEEIVYNEKTQPVQLASANTMNDGDTIMLTGWGSTRVWGKTPDLLHKIDLAYQEHEKCAAAVRNADWLSDGHICSFTKSGEGSCHGDSGGPLVDENHVQIGIVNWGEPCAVGYPDVYASVAYYNDWIQTQLNGDDTSC